MNDENNSLSLGKGKFIKHYFLNFPNGSELQAWIFLTDQQRLIYGHRLRYTDGRKEYYSSSEELDFFELTELENKVTFSLKQTAEANKATIQILDFPPEFNLQQQLSIINSQDSLNSVKECFSLSAKVKVNDIKELDKLWDRGEIMPEDTSSADWLLNQIKIWEKANFDKGRLVEFFGSFFAINPKDNFKIEEDRVFIFGLKETILNTIDGMKSEIINEKDDFLNW